MSSIKNIVFDLGGVLLDINVSRTNQAFEALGISNFKQYYTLSLANPLFEALETGAIKPGEFYASLREITNTNITDTDLTIAWNALLLDWRKQSILHLQTLSENYRLYLFSNTNIIHHAAFMKYFSPQTGLHSFEALFTGVWFSFERKLRKPYAASYQILMQAEGLQPAETIFIDDTLVNIEGAVEAGMQTHHLLPHERIETLSFY